MRTDLSVLGNFKYHIYDITLEVSDDEKEYFVTTSVGSLSVDAVDVLVYPFDDLSKAMTAFQDVVTSVMRQTSVTDMSLYMQQW